MKDVCKYPVIFVHGMFGWGDDEGINNYLPYWGANTCNIIKHYNESGFETHAASVGPASSAWDRACELYARLTGNVVDYGKVHSERCNHKRYGRYYSTPLISNWDSDFFIYNLRYLVSLLYHTQIPITTKIPQLGIIPCCGFAYYTYYILLSNLEHNS